MPGTMALVDWVFWAVLGVSLLLGAWRGLVYEVLSLLGWLAAIVLAQWWAADVAQHLPLGQADPALRYAAGFALVFVAAAFAAGLVASVLKTLVQAVGLRPVDRVLGALFGLLRGGVWLLLATLVVQLTGLQHQPWWQESVLAPWLAQALQLLKPWLPDALSRFLT